MAVLSLSASLMAPEAKSPGTSGRKTRSLWYKRSMPMLRIPYASKSTP